MFISQTAQVTESFTTCIKKAPTARDGRGNTSLTAIELWSRVKHESNSRSWTGRVKLADDQESAARATMKSLAYAGERAICCLMVVQTDLKKDEILSRITSPKEN